jgi:hypothetical protein
MDLLEIHRMSRRGVEIYTPSARVSFYFCREYKSPLHVLTFYGSQGRWTAVLGFLALPVSVIACCVVLAFKYIDGLLFSALFRLRSNSTHEPAFVLEGLAIAAF